MGKVRKCRICKKRPVWRGGDVKNPGPHCKRCYHEHIWPERFRRRTKGAGEGETRLSRWTKGAQRFGLSSEEVAMGLKLGISPRTLVKKKHQAEKSGSTLAGYIRCRFRQQFGKGAAISVAEQKELYAEAVLPHGRDEGAEAWESEVGW
jgi:hypothetical protein